VLRSTAFTVRKRGSTLEFTGRGYGHGVGLCVIGAGRRAARGESAAAILARYYPGLALTRLDAATPALRASTSAATGDINRIAAEAHDALSKVLGTSITPFTVQLHDSLDSFRQATGRPWWVSAVVTGTTIDLAPVALLTQRDGVEATVRIAIAEMLVAAPLASRPAWMRVGAARYFGRHGGSTEQDPASVRTPLRCPSDAELTLAISATAQRDADARAEACFARAYERVRDWRAVR
jgi:hypothetical protein